MLFLTALGEVFNVVTTAALSCDWTAAWVDLSTSNGAQPGSAQGNVAAAATTPVVGAPPDAFTQRQLKSFSIINKDATSSQTVTFEKTTASGSFAYGGTRNIVLAPNESLEYIDSIGWITKDTNGLTKAPVTSTITVVPAALPLPWITTFVPTVTSSAGTPTTPTANMSYQHDPVNFLVRFTATISVTAIGTGSGTLNFTLPINVASGETWTSVGRDVAITGKTVHGLLQAGACGMEFYDNSYPGNTGALIVITGQYHSAT